MLKEVFHNLGWFHVYDCGNGTIAISENYKDTKTTSYLISGDNQSILLDTGCGIGRMKKLVFTLTSTVPTVFNSHACAYHSGANKKFDLVHILNEAHEIDTLTHGVQDDWIDNQEKLTEFEAGFMPEMFTTVSNGSKYALGGKVIEIVANDKTKVNGCMMADHENKSLFCGDIFDEACINALNENEKQKYLQGLKEIINQFKDYTWYFSTGDITGDDKKEALLKKYA